MVSTSIFELLKTKTLTLTTLKSALDSGADINAQDAKLKKTALCVAVSDGQEASVRLLLDQGADPNIKCLDSSRTALWYATSLKGLKNPECIRIIHHLLLYDADMNVLSDDSLNTTPLMNTLGRASNLSNAKEAAKLLLRNPKCDKNLANKAGNTAMKMANSMKTMKSADAAVWIAILEAKQPNILMRSINAAIGQIAALISHTASIVNRITGGRFSKYFGFLGKKSTDPKLQKPAAADPKNPEELKAEMISQIRENGLEKFFPPDDPFLETIITKAAALANREVTTTPSGNRAFRNRGNMPGASTGPKIPDATPKPSLSNPTNVKSLTRLSLYQPILFLDNSISMETQNGVRIKVMHEIVERVLNVTTLLVPDDAGVLIRLLHPNAQPDPFPRPIRNADIPQAVKDLEKVKYDYCTPLGTNLKKGVLEEFVYKPVREGKFERPVLISIITDGEPNTEEIEFQDALRECREFMWTHDYDPKFVRFHLSQVGNDGDAEVFLNKIRDDVKLKDMVFVATERLDDKLTQYRENNEQLEIWLMRTLLGPIEQVSADDD